MSKPHLNIGWKQRAEPSLPNAINEGIRDGRAGTPNPYYLSSPILRKHYLNGYQCGFRERKWPRDFNARSEAFYAMHEARYPHYIQPPMA